MPKVLSIVGGAASGKSTLAVNLASKIKSSGLDSVVILTTDDYSVGTRDFRETQLRSTDPYVTHNFELLSEHIGDILKLRPRQQIIVPKYNPGNGAGVPPVMGKPGVLDTEKYTSSRLTGSIELVIIEGDFQPLKNTDFIIYLHLADNLRLENRIRRDIRFRSYETKDHVLKSFIDRQRSQHFIYTLPVAEFANLIIWSEPKKHNGISTYTYNLFR